MTAGYSMLIGVAIVGVTTVAMAWLRRRLIAKYGRQQWPKSTEIGLTVFTVFGILVGVFFVVVGINMIR